VALLPRHAASLALVLAACGSPSFPVDSASAESSGGSTSSSSSATSTETSSTESSNTFVPDYDQPDLTECSGFAQDCPDGEKCVPYQSMGTHFDGEKCVPVTGDQAPGEPCTYGGFIEATDDCDESSGCWYVHEVDGEQVGICLAFCSGTADDPQCPPGSSCVLASEPSPAFCVVTCDPLAQDCGAGLGCYWANVEFHCLPATQNVPEGQPCGFYNDCAPGLVCLPTEVLPACAGSACCGRWCNHDLGDAQCETTPGTTCELFFQEGTTPPGQEHIGVCAVPAP
jgi:hypothetical protein